MPYDSNLIFHIRAVNEFLQNNGGTAELDAESLKLRIRANGKYVELEPQFVFPKDGSIAFSPKLVSQAQDFCGWRAYFNRIWGPAIDKTEFKNFCERNNLRTPMRWLSASEVDGNAIAKKPRSSFAQGIVGPFTPEMLRSSNYALTAGDFFEEFVPGAITKIWYWKTDPVCVEMRAMPTVVGDGKRSLKNLIGRTAIQFSPIDWLDCESIGRFQGLALDSIIADGQKVMIDFRYLSPFHSPEVFGWNQNILSKLEGTELLRQLRNAGKQFFTSIPESIRNDTLYSIDAIVDGQDRVWFLEMNCNPIVHPDVYAPMLASIFDGVTANSPRH